MHFSCLEDEELGPEIEEVQAREVNFASRYINLSDILGANDWGRKNRAKERSSIIGAGFNGGGLCIFSWLGKYVEYLQSSCPKAKLFKKDGQVLRFVFWNQQGRESVTSTLLPIWVANSFKHLRVGLIGGKQNYVRA